MIEKTHRFGSSLIEKRGIGCALASVVESLQGGSCGYRRGESMYDSADNGT